MTPRPSTPPSPIPLHPSDPPLDCPLCPRLAEYRAANRTALPGAFNAPVPSWGPPDARLLVVGLAPGVKGANATGRPFTGDYAGDLLYATLLKHGFAKGRFEARPDDSLEPIDARITNAVRCVPPQNKPTGPEVSTCRDFLRRTIAEMPRLRVLVALGKIAHDATLRTLGARVAAHKFGHRSRYEIEAEGRAFTLLSSYHCSRYNTNTGVLTPEMFDAVFADVAAVLEG